MNRVEMTRFMCGLIYMQVCAVPDATDEEILEVCNRENPSGTTAGWTRVVRDTSDVRKAPGPCEEYPTRTHFLVSC